MPEARGSGSPAFHEWRKRIKTLWYALRLLEQRVPMDPQLTELKRLEEWLGDDQIWLCYGHKLPRTVARTSGRHVSDA